MPIEIPEAPKRLVLVNAKVPPEVRDRLKVEAKKKGHNLSSYLRSLCEAQVGRKAR